MESYKEKLEVIEKNFSTDFEKGLTDDLVIENKRKYGSNELTKEKSASIFKKIQEAISEPMVIILIVAAVITLAINVIKQFTGGEPDYVECVGIFVAVMLSVTITIVMEGRSAKAFEALNRIKENVLVKAIRNGSLMQLPQKEIVVGDIIRFETGDKIPIDGRLIETVSLTVDESPLTGESMAVKKDASAAFDDKDVPLAERNNMMYSGCYVTGGGGTVVVTEVGDTTEFGKIAKQLTSAAKTSTPLQEKLALLGKKITMFGAAAAGLVFIIQLVQLFMSNRVSIGNIGEIFVTSIVLIVAAVPEGLPTIVAVSLALNVIKMAKQNALVKKIIASETVGSINVICSDKTGTLTENKMTVTDIIDGNALIKPSEMKNENLIINFGVNSTGNIELKSDGIYDFIGSSTECALLVALEKSGISYKGIRDKADIIHVYPFSSEIKNMTTVIEKDGTNIAYTKGSPEKILSLVSIEHDEKEKVNEEIMKLQGQAKRILAFAHKEISGIDDFDTQRHDIESNMIFDGFVAITDPVRKDVYDAVRNCKSAGISIKMLTGDNIITARAIATELGFVEDKNQVFHASDIENMSDAELEGVIDNIRVIARSTPSTKLRIVNMLKARGNVVAVTGDGVNDAPAIKNADVGIAMGITGTEVSKEASDIVLLDDSFSTIVKAIHWGRGIYENFQRFLQFQLTVNLSAVVTVLASVISGIHSPFSALQLLWINIIMDGPPALSLGLEPIKSDLMKRDPIKRDASIVSKLMFSKILINGLYISIIFLSQSRWNFIGAATREEEATVLFTLFVLFQLFNAFNAREIGKNSIFKNFTGNKVMLGAFALTFVLQFIITQFGGKVFKTVPLDFLTWVKIIMVAFSVILIAEISKLISRMVSKGKELS